MADPKFRSQLYRWISCAILALPLFLQMISPIELPRFVQAILATAVQFGFGWPFYESSWRGLKTRTFNMDSLVALGTSAAYFYSLAFIATTRPLYFDASAILITMILLGRLLETLTYGKASEAITSLLNLAPKMARVRRGGETIEIPASELVVGEEFVIRPGEAIPVDGEIVTGSSMLDEAMLTGESLPVSKGIGDQVFAGTINKTGAFTARVSGIGADTQLGAIIKLVEEAQSSRAPIQRLADKVASIFVPIVILIALVTLILWWSIGGIFVEGLVNAVAVLVVACPCALGLAVPVAMMVGAGRGAEMGILIRDAAALERAKGITRLGLDKTGTLTEGRPTVVGEVDPEVLAIAAAVETLSEHPLAAAIVDRAGGMTLPTVTEFEAVPGKGARALVEGRRVAVGSPRFYQESTGKTASGDIVVWGEGLFGTLNVSDPVRGTSAEAIGSLKEMKIEPVMITGDHRKTAQEVAEAVGIDQVIAEVLPAEKAAKVEELKEGKHVVGMVGDGINDAPALAAADVGFAIGAGSDVAIEAADITLLRDDLRSAVRAIRLSRATFRKMGQNLFFAFVYNCVGIPIAAAGLLSPVIAGVAMAASSLSVILNALLLRRQRL